MTKLNKLNYGLRNVDCPNCGKKSVIELQGKYYTDGRRNFNYRTPNRCEYCNNKLP